MAAAAAPPNIYGAPPPFFVENLFFKSYPDVKLSEGEDVALSEALQRSSCQGLVASSKFGFLVATGREGLTLFRAEDVVSAQIAGDKGHQKHVPLSEVPRIPVKNGSFGSVPIVLAVSNGEEYLAVDTCRNGVAFVLVFQLEMFLTTGGQCGPFAEFRASMKEGSKVCGIAWNPGENMGNILAVNSDDGFLQLVTLKGAKNVETCSYKGIPVRSMCWSPKGKQLVVGKVDGSLSQLKLDLSEAKVIPPPPGPSRIPTAIFWTSTTQFLINYLVEGKDVDFMQLDLAKGAPPSYGSFGDIFASDRIDMGSKCCFLPILPWNIIMCPSNTINDLVVMGKGLHAPGENWVMIDINDNRRAAIPIDSFCVGATLFFGQDAPTTFSDAEIYHQVPTIFALSHCGSLCSYSLVNGKADAPSVFHPVQNKLPNISQTLWTKSQQNVAANQPSFQTTIPSHFGGAGDAPHIFTSAPSFSAITSTPSNLGGLDSFNLSSISTGFASISSTTTANTVPPPMSFNLPTTSTSTNPNLSFKPQVQITPEPQQRPSTSLPQPPQQQPLFDLKTLPLSGLPSLEQVGDLKKIVEEKRAQISNGAKDSQDEEEPDLDELLLEVEKFQKRLELFHKRRNEAMQLSMQGISDIRKQYDNEVLTPLNLLENFVGTLKDTKEVQRMEVHSMKEKILSGYTQLEYARALEERSKDPKYIGLLLSQPMDVCRAKKFAEMQKLYLYVKRQMAECERHYKSTGNQDISGNSAVQGILQTLSNHSKVIKKLAYNVNQIRSEMGLRRIPEMEDFTVFELPTMGHTYSATKSLMKERPVVTLLSTVPKIKAQKEFNRERRTVDELSAGMSSMMLSKSREGKRYSFPTECFCQEAKPIKITTQKLNTILKVVTKTVDIEVPEPNKRLAEMTSSVTSNRVAKSRALIEKLDDKTVPTITHSVEETAPELSKLLTTKLGDIKATDTSKAAEKPSTGGTFGKPAAGPASFSGITQSGFASSSSAPAPAPTSLFGTPSGAGGSNTGPAFAVNPISNFMTTTQSPKESEIKKKVPVPSKPAENSPFSATTETPKKEERKVEPKPPLFPPLPAVSLPKTTLSGAPTFSFASPPNLFGDTAPSAQGQGGAAPPPLTSVTSSGGTTVFGSLPTTAVSTTSPPTFGNSPSTTGSIFGAVPAASPSSSIFGAAPSTSLSSSIFGGLSLSDDKSNTTPAFAVKPISNLLPTTQSAKDAEIKKTEPSKPAEHSQFSATVETPKQEEKKSEPTPSLFPPVTSAVTLPNTTASTVSTFSFASAAPSVFGGVPSGAQPLTSAGGTSVFGSLPAVSTTSPPIFGNSPSTQSTGSVFGTTTATSPSSSIFGAAPATTTTSSSIFGAAPATTTTSSSIFGAAPATATSPSSSIFGGLSLSDGKSTNASSVFGGAPVTAFGGSPATAFGNSATTAFGGSAATAFGGSPAPAFGGSAVFGGTPSALGGSPSGPAFGGAAVFGSSSPFGAAFGSSTAAPSPTSGSGGGSIFGGGGAATQGATSFGALAQSTGPSQAPGFGSFGGSPSTFGTTFGSNTAQSPSSPIGSGSIFGEAAPNQSVTSFGGSAQPSGFGSFGGGGTPSGSMFGSSSTFGASFGSSTATPPGGSGNIFGGSGASMFGGQPTPSFGQPQQAAQPPAFGGNPATPSFGGSAFTSWR